MDWKTKASTSARRIRIGLAGAGGALAGALLGWAAAIQTGGEPALYASVFAAAVGPVAAAGLWLFVLDSSETRRLEAASAADVERSWSRDAAAAAFTDLMVLIAAGVVVQAVTGWPVPLPLYCGAGLAAWTLRYALIRHRNA